MSFHTNLQEELSQCDRQPIHLISSIQPSGFLLAINPLDRKIAMASENIQELFGKSFSDVVGDRLESYFSTDEIKFLFSFHRQNSYEPTSARFTGPEGQLLDALVYSSQGLIVVEMDIMPEDYDSAKMLSELQGLGKKFSEDLGQQMNLQRASKYLCQYIRQLTGMERVMLYRFLPNWDGEVIAEDKTPEAHSFNQHRFPASDIPLPARKLYLQNRTRLIPDTAAEAVRIYPALNPLNQSTLDMSASKLRAVPLVHLEYLKNMGVRSSFSVAVIHNGQLWGLVACHGMKPTFLSLDVRKACEVLASSFASLSNLIEEVNDKKQRLQFESGLRNLVQKVIVKSDPMEAFFKLSQDVCQIFEAAGMALVSSDRVSIAGLTPPETYIRQLVDQAQKHFGSEGTTIVQLESLSDLDPSWRELKHLASGALIVPLIALDNSVFLIFRPELLGQIVWGGDPRKTLDKRNYQGSINPRLSFESWTQSIHDRSAPWKDYEVEGCAYIRDVIFEGILRRNHLILELGRQLERRA